MIFTKWKIFIIISNQKYIWKDLKKLLSSKFKNKIENKIAQKYPKSFNKKLDFKKIWYLLKFWDTRLIIKFDLLKNDLQKLLIKMYIYYILRNSKNNTYKLILFII